MSVMKWFRAAFARADSLALIERKLDAMASIHGQMFVVIRKRLNNLEAKDMTPQIEQLILDVRALIAALPSPAALSEAQAQVVMLTADITAATADNAQLHEIVAKTSADALWLATDNDKLTAELQAIKERLAPPTDVPQGAPV